MTTYVALLRGINLGPTNKIAMPALRAMTEELGYTDVATYISSGNLIFRTSKKAPTVERALTKAITETFGLTIDVMVRNDAQLKKVLDVNPYPDANPSQLTVAFLAKPPGPKAKEQVAAAAAEHEPFTFGDRCVYVNYSCEPSAPSRNWWKCLPSPEPSLPAGVARDGMCTGVRCVRRAARAVPHLDVRGASQNSVAGLTN